MIKRIQDIIKSSIEVKSKILVDELVVAKLQDVSELIAESFRKSKKVLLCGNGGSAADAQHLAAEFSGRFYRDRRPLPAEALHVNTSYLTAVANDYSYEEVYSRMVTAQGSKGDVIIGISTSGNSKNVVKALKTAKKLGLITIAFTGENGGNMAEYSDFIFKVPSDDTPRIQESHILLGHIICELVEDILF